MDVGQFATDVRDELGRRGWNQTDLAVRLGETDCFPHMAAAKTWLSRLLAGQAKEPLAAPFLAVCAELKLNPVDYGLPAIPVSTIPVIALASAGEGEIFTDQGYPAGQGMTRIERPPDLQDPNAFAVEVDGDSMFPKYEDGQIVYVDTTKTPVNGDYAVVGLVTGQKYVKRWRARDGMITLESVNPEFKPLKVPREKVAFAYKVVGTRER